MYSLDALLALCERYMPPKDLALVRAAYEAAAKAHAGVCRMSGEPYIDHPLAVACILTELAVDAHGIAAALLHDTVEDTPLSLDAVRVQFGAQIAAIVDGVTKFSAVEAPKIRDEPEEPQDVANGAKKGHVPPLDGPEDIRDEPAVPVALPPEAAREQKALLHAETVHKLFLAMLRDPRVVLLKLADRLHNMRTMRVMSPRQRAVKSQEVLDIYAPLAGRIGLYNVKGELEDLAFAYLHPDEAERTFKALRAEEQRRGEWAQRMGERMRHELGESGITAAVNWRMKRAYRAWVESQENGIRIAALNDLIAFRVLVNSVPECYRAMGEIHRVWMPHERIRDYIATSKNNGYQSLHTAVFGLDGHLAPIHIRTHEMHRASQHGVAAHWLERAAAGTSGASGESLVRQMPEWVNQLANWEGDLKLDAVDFLSAVRGEMLEDDSVFVFTPRGEVHELPAGATVLDLAYRIHTRIGDQAIGAQIQTTSRGGAIVLREVSIDYVLQTGDVVYVRTDLHSHPRPEWRTIAVTRYAQEKMGRALRLLHRAQAAETTGARSEPSEPSAENEPELPPQLRHPSGKVAEVRLARCCYPCPPDEIVGVPDRMTDGRGVTIHRRCCRTLRRIIERRALQLAEAAVARGSPGGKNAHPAQAILQVQATRQGEQDDQTNPLSVSWDELGAIPYRLHLAIYGQDHRGLMYEVSSCVAALGLNVVYTKALANQDRSKALIALTVDIPPDVRRDVVMRRLRAVPGVTEVERDTRRGCDEHPSAN